VTSHLTKDFIECFRQLPQSIRKQAGKTYQLWKNNPHHPSLEFKPVGKNKPIYSVRIGLGWRAFGLIHKEQIIWFWIGSHAEYDRLIKQFY
jgi:hypothetical protein